jgi:unsaturated chondroitin disaccharide hydrolase
MTELGAYVSSWGPIDDERGRSSSAIDTMANLPLLYWAAEHVNDASYRFVAEAHARMTLGAFVRDDASTYHAVTYDVASGKPNRRYTFQGYADESCWSRGQAWAIYGCAATAQATGSVEYLSAAERLGEYFLRRLDDSLIPYWDFDDPAIPHAPRDSSAAAVAASAFLDLAALHPNRSKGQIWHERAQGILTSLCRDYLARTDGHRGLLLHGCYSRPHRIGEDSAVLFGDYFFAEAICKVRWPGKLYPILHPLKG